MTKKESAITAWSAKVQRLFQEALARPRDERLPFLDNACGSDKTIRGELESLLRHYETASDWFHSRMCTLRGLFMLSGPRRTRCP